MMLVSKQTIEGRELKGPYVKVRHIAIFASREEAEKVAWKLNYGLYHPIGLTTEEIKILMRDDRSKYYIEKNEVIERLIG